MGALPDDATLTARRLTVFSNGLYAAPDYLAERGEPALPSDLLQHDAVRLLGGDGEPSAWVLRRGEEHWQGLPPGRAMANSPELLMRLARAGAGIAAVPDYFVTPMLQRGELRRVLPEWCLPSHAAWAVFPGRKLMPSKTRVFIDMLQAALSGNNA
jgi:DNA-binding transcriptional LysR family regulator